MPTKPKPRTLDALYREHHGWLCVWLYQRLECSETAADLAQDTFLKILSSKDPCRQVAEIREPRRYLATIAGRLLADRFRRLAMEEACLEALAQRPEALDISPEERLLLIESLLELDAMLHGLGAKVRRAFLLSQLHGMRYADIAAELDVTPRTVKRYMAKATLQCLLYVHEHGLT